MKIVEYYMKGEPLQSKSFTTTEAARAFMSALNENPFCESYTLVK